MERETAMKILKELHGKSLFAERTALETLIPELTESKDEKIRNALIRFHKSTIDVDGIKGADIIAWLEKQGSSSAKWQKNTPDNKPAINHSVLMKTTQGIVEGYFVGSLWFQFRWSSNIKDSDVLAWMELSDLDEQGEQKPVIDFKAKNWYVSKVDGKIHDMTYNPADKVEPKFKVGDYIVSDYCMGRVVEITNDAYLLDTGQGILFSCHSTRLWDISDAKDGDVLHSSEHKLLWIYKNKEEYHAAINLNYANFVSFGADIVIPSDVHPATKEQRDLLFQKMKEAGYTFDFDKKELKKIEDEIEIPFGAKDSELQEATYYIPKGFHAEIDDDKVIIKKGEKSSAWNEEDENYLQSAENACEYQYGKNTSTILWLKSLKDRIGG